MKTIQIIADNYSLPPTKKEDFEKLIEAMETLLNEHEETEIIVSGFILDGGNSE